MSSYYAYGDINPSALVSLAQGDWEDIANWPRTYKYLSTHEISSQGLHLPAPAYQLNQTYQPGMFFYGGNPGVASYGYNGAYPYSTTTGWPFYSPSSYTSYPYSSYSPYYSPLNPYYNTTNLSYPYAAAPYSYPYQYPGYPGAGYPGAYLGGYPGSYLGATGFGTSCSCPCPQLLNQATQVLAANSALAATPNAPFMWVGQSQAEINIQNAILAAHYGMSPLANVTAGMSSQVVPYKPAAGEQFWCKEPDGSWTLREQKDLMEAKILPGHWERHATSGYFYWIRHTS